MSEHHKAPNKSQMDMHQIFKHAFDDKTGSLRTTPGTNTNFEITLNSDQDSITAVCPQLTISGETTVSCVGIKTICAYGQTKVEISPSDTGDDWFTVADQSTGIGAVTPICARRIKTTGANAKVVGQG